MNSAISRRRSPKAIKGAAAAANFASPAPMRTGGVQHDADHQHDHQRSKAP